MSGFNAISRGRLGLVPSTLGSVRHRYAAGRVRAADRPDSTRIFGGSVVSNHQSSAVLAALLTAAVVSVLGYRIGRTHAVWRDVRKNRQSLRVTRREAWSRTVHIAAATALAVAALLTAAIGVSR